MSRDVFIVSAVRTPIGKFGGALAELTAADLGVHVVRAAVERAFGAAPPARVPGEAASDAVKHWKAAWHVDEVIFGNARAAGVGPNVARQIAWRSGLGDDVPAFTVNMACASGLRSILLGWQQIKMGEAEMVVAGGTESMSRVPYLVDARWGLRMGNQPLTDAMYRDGFMCPMANMVMGETAELLAEKYKISREEQDRFALESQHRAARAAQEGRFLAEIVSIERVDKKGKTVSIESDEHVRGDVTLEALGKLPPVFADKGGTTGTITAGNSSGITDGAAAVVLASGERVRELGLKPLARIHDASTAAVDPREMGIGPVPAVRKLEKRSGWKLADYTTVELNEAFAAQVVACDRELEFDGARLNPNGGAIALGHPIGATGARITATLVHELQRQKGARRGLATLCVSGGMGVAMAIEGV
ncbi:MAG TPA: thiolase family protein [Candidatus Acidoferrales bacterium]|nr:thiolase family protein [Candidatus Acidoferrales bacterium]